MKQLAALHILFIFSFSFLHSQEKPINFQHINAKNGLSQGHILCMIQDSQGYIWAGTYHGLNRFNGYNFDVFYSDPADPHSMFINVVFSLYEDSRGRIWCGTWGMNVYNPRTGSFELNITAGPDPGSISAGEVSTILEDHNGNMWFATQGGGLNKYHLNDSSITIFRANTENNQSLNSDYINDIVLDKKNNLWIATEDGGLSRMNLDNEKIITYLHHSDDPNSLSSNRISCLYLDNNDRLWLGDNQGHVSTFSPDQDNFKNFNCCPKALDINNTRIFQITEDWNGNLVLATNGAGLVFFDPATNASRVLLHDSDKPESLISNENSSLLIDKTNTLFVGSFGRGISKYSPFSSKFEVFRQNSKDPKGDINAYTDAIEDGQGNLVVGTYHGFFVYNTKTWANRHYLPGNTYESNKILTAELAPDGTIWIATMAGIHRYNKNYQKLQTYTFDPSLKDQSVYTLEFDHENILWVGLFTRGLLRIEEDQWRDTQKSDLDFELYLTDYNDSSSIQGNQQWIVYEDSDSNLWIGGVGGLSRYNRTDNNFERIFDQGSVKTIAIDSKKNIWIGTIGVGLYDLNLKNNTIKKYTTEDGLNHSFIYGIIADKNDEIWISSEGGLNRFSPESEVFRNYDMRDGLPDDHFDDKAESLLSDGRIYMGTNNGFVIFDPLSIQDDTSSVRIVLTRLIIDNQSTEFYYPTKNEAPAALPVSQVNIIRLSPTQHDISFEFAALHYAAPHKIQYAYQLEGYDKQWIYTNALNRTAKYTNLDGGEYVFKVKATNSDGYWTKEIMMIRLIKKPPYYKTKWFIIGIMVFALFITYLIFSQRIAAEVKQKKILSQKVEERTKEIQLINKQLQKNANALQESNTLLEERQQQVEEQSEELASQRDDLALSNATKDKLFSLIAHDLKNPFNVILGYTDLLLINFGKWSEDRSHYFLTLLKETSESAYRLLENLLHWSRSQSGSIKYRPQNIRVEELVMNSIKDIQSLANKKDIKIELEIEKPTKLTVNADTNMINIVLRNLITNSIKFSKKYSKIKVSASAYNTHKVLFKVTDNGIGIPAAHVNSLFDLNTSSSTAGTEGEKGTGLGLILCREFVDYHSGKIWVESKPDIETTIFFTLPGEK